MKRVTPKFSRSFTENLKEILERQWSMMKSTVMTWKLSGNSRIRVSAGGGCEAAVTARKKCGLVKFWDYSELLCGSRFCLWLKGV